MHLLKVLIKTVRDNLDIKVEPRIANGKTQILNFLKTHKGLCGIIYTFTRKEAESTAEFLSESGYSAKAYHAGLSNDRKNEVFEYHRSEGWYWPGGGAVSLKIWDPAGKRPVGA